MLSAIYKKDGLLKQNLFVVEGDLVENYNRVLEKTIGKRTELTSFRVDKRGESPEIEDELGKHYLQSGPAHRYCIVVSPEQKNAGLIHEEFSFDHLLLDFLYENYLPGISVATRVDGLCGEFDHGVRAYETLEDLLLIKRISLELHTPSGFLTKARELQSYVAQLQNNPELLIENESELLNKILRLVNEVGDIRNYNLVPIGAKKEITTFYTRFFDGVFIFDNVEQEKTIQMKRPGSREKSDTLTDSKQNRKKPKAVVIYNSQKYQPEDGPAVKFLSLQDKKDVINFLIKFGYAVYSYGILESRLSRIENMTLLKKGYDVTEMPKERHIQLLNEYREAMLPEWYELKNIKRQVGKGYKFMNIINDYSEDVRNMMLIANPALSPDVVYVVEHLLTKLYLYDYEKMYLYNQRDLGYIYTQADENIQKYIAKILKGVQK